MMHICRQRLILHVSVFKKVFWTCFCICSNVCFCECVKYVCVCVCIMCTNVCVRRTVTSLGWNIIDGWMDMIEKGQQLRWSDKEMAFGNWFCVCVCVPAVSGTWQDEEMMMRMNCGNGGRGVWRMADCQLWQCAGRRVPLTSVWKHQLSLTVTELHTHSNTIYHTLKCSAWPPVTQPGCESELYSKTSDLSVCPVCGRWHAPITSDLNVIHFIAKLLTHVCVHFSTWSFVFTPINIFTVHYYDYHHHHYLSCYFIHVYQHSMRQGPEALIVPVSFQYHWHLCLCLSSVIYSRI